MKEYCVVRNGDYVKNCKRVSATCKPDAAKRYIAIENCKAGDVVIVWLTEPKCRQAFRVYIMPNGSQSVLPYGI